LLCEVFTFGVDQDCNGLISGSPTA